MGHGESGIDIGSRLDEQGTIAASTSSAWMAATTACAADRQSSAQSWPFDG
jgi:hypothetical protein